MVATSSSPLTDTSPSKTALPTTVTVEPNWVAPVAVSVPPILVLPAVSILPETEVFPLTITLPPKLPSPATVRLLTDTSPPIEAVIPLRLEPSPKKALAQTLFPTANPPFTLKSLVICPVPTILTPDLVTATWNLALLWTLLQNKI